MTRLVTFPLEGGGSVLVEVTDGFSNGGVVTRGLSDVGVRVVEQAQQSLERAFVGIQPAVKVLLDQCRSIAESPDEVQVEFGVQLNAELGAFVAGASASGNFKVTVVWRTN